MNDQSLHWGDLRTVLVIFQTGSLSGAAETLHVSHATVFRRLGDIEQRLGARLFERSRMGYTPTPAGEEIAEVASRIDTEVTNLHRRIVGQDLRPSGTIRITTTDSLLLGLLSPIFAKFRTVHSEIALEVVVSNQLFNLSKREADVAIRPTMSPPENLIGRKIGTIAQAVYARKGYSSQGESMESLKSKAWVGPDEKLGYHPLELWMKTQELDKHCRYKVDTVQGMHAAVREGMGLAVLPCYLCDRDPHMERISDFIHELATDLWILTHPDLRRVVRIKVFFDFISSTLNESQHLLAGGKD